MSGQGARARANYGLPGIGRGPECQHAALGLHTLALGAHSAGEVSDRGQVSEKVGEAMRGPQQEGLAVAAGGCGGAGKEHEAGLPCGPTGGAHAGGASGCGDAGQ